MRCTGYADLHKDLDLADDKDLVRYFNTVIKKRIDDEVC